jgi:hypothetical protein
MTVRDGNWSNAGSYCASPSGTLVYRDADGDGYGDAAMMVASCDGTIPAGYAANPSDCNDASVSAHPGAAELCNGVDDDCNGTADDTSPPGPLNSLTMPGSMQAIEWTALPAAQTYDVVFGNLGLLHASGGDFTAAAQGCLEYHTGTTSAAFMAQPGVGQALWVLARGNNCAGSGTYDSGDPSQVGTRDAEIEASSHSCAPSVCGDGTCNGTETCASCPDDCAVVYLEDDFSDNSAGWTLGYEWQIGPVQASLCAEYGADDPATDHTLTGDNGVAGIVLGGCAAGAMHDYAYLESPPLNTSTAPGVMFSFYRWLNSDAPPFMTSDIEVWNGSQWVAVWTQPGFTQIMDAPVAGGPGWNLNEFDLTPYRNAAMRIRFGMRIGDPQVYDFGSWNIDDVLVASCPSACGDGSCNFGETCGSCPSDCGVCPPACGDGSCNGSETCATCPGDCGACPPVCGDGSCNGTETCNSCPGDCGACPSCGDGTCNGFETCSSCPGDCGTCPPVCGDGTCNGTETCATCPGDCGVCPPPVCGDGTCNGTETCASCPGDCAAVYFEDDFSDNSAGWTLGYEWQIGPAQASQCAEFGADDPGTDHSSTSDEGVAGVIIGGCAGNAMHAYAYLESPAFDTSTGNAGVTLSFYRWLDSDAPPFMTSDIEVWSGSQWVPVWTQPTDGFPLFDNPVAGGPGWNLQQFDLTPYRNAAMRIRFGVKVENPDVYSVGSWNIDDLRVSSTACP